MQLMVLCDGEWYTPAWSRLSYAIKTGEMHLEILDPAPTEKGAQRMRPLKPEELRVMNGRVVVEDFAHALSAGIV